jgi:hypothetical protein
MLILGALVVGVSLGALGSLRAKPSPVHRSSRGLEASTPSPATAETPTAPTDVQGTAQQAVLDRSALVRAVIDLRDVVQSEAVREQLGEALERVGIAEVRVDGQPFDPHRHHAVDRTGTSDAFQHNVVAVTERPGYRDRGVELRAPEVVVYRFERSDVTR